MQAFKAPKTSLGNLDAEAAAILISAAADIALIIDEAGVIRDAAFNSGDLAQEIAESGCRPRQMEISEIFPEEYFREKYILYVAR